MFLLPALFLMLIGLVVPAMRTIYTSFLDNNGKKFIGFDNYTEIFTRPRHPAHGASTASPGCVVGTVVTVVVGLTIARFADGMRGEKAAKSLIFIPGAISLVGAGIIWRFVYAGPPFKVGLLNAITKRSPGCPSHGRRRPAATGWSSAASVRSPRRRRAPGFNTFLLIVIFIWASTGFATVRVLGGHEGRARVAHRGGHGRRRHQPAGVLQGDAALHPGHHHHRGHHHHHRRPEGVRHRGRHHRRQLRHQHHRQRVLPRVLRAEPRSGLGSALAVLIFILVVPVVVINRRAQARAEEMMAA